MKAQRDRSSNPSRSSNLRETNHETAPKATRPWGSVGTRATQLLQRNGYSSSASGHSTGAGDIVPRNQPLKSGVLAAYAGPPVGASRKVETNGKVQ